MSILCYPGSGFSRQMMRFGGRPDFNCMTFMERYLRPGDGFLDVGANIGAYTLLAAALVTESGFVDAFEPAPVALRQLRENIRFSCRSNVRVHGVAVSQSSGTKRLLSDRDSGNRIQVQGDPGNTVQVTSVTLDSVVGANRYALGKLDIEGAEPLALQGAKEMLASANPPVWIMELNGRCNDYGVSEDVFLEWLTERGFVPALFDGLRRKLSVGEQRWREVSSASGEANILLLKRARLEWIQDRLVQAS